jgi:tetratricopeptide (TPR) repeat protein
MSQATSRTTDDETRQALQFRWIIGNWPDLLLFVGTPLLIAPLFFAAQLRFSGETIFLIVSCFGALGHHAPGLMRAYGDRALFRRFRIRFTVVPLAAIVVCSLFTLEEMSGVMLVLLVWGVWHFLMQTYGFARIYDARLGCHNPADRHLDLAMCICWFGAAVLSAPDRIREFSSLAYKCGLPVSYTIPIDQVRTAWMVVTVGVTALFFWNIARRLHQGLAISGNKLLLLAATFLFFWICSVSLTEFLVGVAMFEVFHDIQYLSIVWIFNQNRVRKGEDAGAFTRFFFRRSGALIGVYVGLVVAYGMIGFAAETISSEMLKTILFAVVATSNVLHFYYDGFIWKIREPETRASLGVDGASVAASTRRRMVGGLTHALKWAVLGAILAVIGLGERSRNSSQLEQARAVALVAHDSSLAHALLARELVHEKRYETAIQAATRSAELSSQHYQTFLYGGVALASTGREREALPMLERAHDMHPQSRYLQFHLAMTYGRLGRLAEAVDHLRTSLEISPDDADAHYNLGIFLYYQGEYGEASRHFANAARIEPNHIYALFWLGEMERITMQLEKAESRFRRALEIDPNFAEAHYGLAAVRRMQQQPSQANAHLVAAIEASAAEEFATPQRIAQRVQWARELVQATGRNDPDAFDLLADAYRSAGETSAAEAAEEEALAVRTRLGGM